MARYSDGRTALTQEIVVSVSAKGLSVGAEIWAWESLRRTDDGGAAVIFRREPDTGERVTLSDTEADAAKAIAPVLFTRRALRTETPLLIGALVAAAGALAAIFLVGVPLAAEPIARIVPERYQTHLGDLAWGQVNALSEQCEGEYGGEGWNALGRMFDRLQAHTQFARQSEIFVVDAPFPNAFTLPDGSIVLTDDLIGLAESPDEIAGVLAHELGHVEARHVMTNVVRQMGLGLFVDIVFGGAGAGQTVAAINLLALRYTRADETEADAIAIDLMNQAGLNPAGSAPLFRRLAAEERATGLGIPELFSSHPDTLRRANEAERHARPERPAALSAADWQAVRAICGPAGEPARPLPNPLDLLKPSSQ